MRIEPVFIRYTDSGWVTLSPWQPRSTHRSSTHPARCGSQSETSMPLWPYLRKVRFEARSLFLSTPRRVFTRANAAGDGLAWGGGGVGLVGPRVDVARPAAPVSAVEPAP